MEQEPNVPEFSEEQEDFFTRVTDNIYFHILIGMRYDIDHIILFESDLPREAEEKGLDPDFAKAEIKKRFINKVDSFFETLNADVRRDLKQMRYIGPSRIEELFEVRTIEQNENLDE